MVLGFELTTSEQKPNRATEALICVCACVFIAALLLYINHIFIAQLINKLSSNCVDSVHFMQ